MKIAKGKLRFVVALPSLGIAIKFPRIYFLRMFYQLLRDVLFLSWVRVYRMACFGIDSPAVWGYRKMLFAGIRTNWREFRFFRTTRNPFCQPTYFSFFGLLNIQKFAETPCNLHWRVLAVQIYEITNELSRMDGHHFEFQENFCFEGGKLRILDYGSPKTQLVIVAFGEKILATFDPNWVEKIS